MLSRDYKDLIGGSILALLGLGVAVQSVSSFDLGTFSRMGPGMFPLCLGALLVGLGTLIAVPALFRPGERIDADWRPLVFVMSGVLGFALTVRPFGLVPAIVVLTVVSGLGDSEHRPLGLAIVAAVLAGAAYLIFPVGLGVTLAPFKWPF